MSGFRLAPEAAHDIERIWRSLARERVPAARRVRLALLAACRQWAEHPGLGQARKDLTDKPVLFWPVCSSLIVYNPTTQPLEIVHVVHGVQDLPRLLR